MTKMAEKASHKSSGKALERLEMRRNAFDSGSGTPGPKNTKLFAGKKHWQKRPGSIKKVH